MFRQNYLCTIEYYLNLSNPTKILILLWPRILTTKEGNMDEFVVSYDHKVVVFEEEKSPFMRPVWVAGGQLVPEQIFYSIQISPIVIKYHHFLLYFKYFPPLSNTILHYPVLSNTIQYYPMLSKITIIMLNYSILSNIIPWGQWLSSGMIIAILWTFIPLVVQKIIAKVCKTLLFTKKAI